MLFADVYQEKRDAPELMFVCSALSWMTLLNPLSTLFFVKAYRHKALQMVLRKSISVSDGSSLQPDKDTMGAVELSLNEVVS